MKLGSLLALLSTVLVVPGCLVVAVGAVAAAGAVVAINATTEDTVRSELKDVAADKVYQTACTVLQRKGSLIAKRDEQREVEGDLGADHVRVSVWNLNEHVVVEVKARQVIGALPSPNTAQAVTHDLLGDLGVAAETTAAKRD